MTYFVTAHTNHRTMLLVSETRTTDKAIADMVAAHLVTHGYVVVQRKEG